jgi:hypothetical protein
MIDFGRLDHPPPEDLCPERGCEHPVTHLGFTPRHRWSFNCSAGMWWEGCSDTGSTGGCPCPGCKPRRTPHTRRLDARLTNKCHCARTYPDLARWHAEKGTT